MFAKCLLTFFVIIPIWKENRTPGLSPFLICRNNKTLQLTFGVYYGFQSPADPMKRIIADNFLWISNTFGEKFKLLLPKFQVSLPKVPPHCFFRQVRTRTKMHTCLRLTQCRITFITTTRTVKNHFQTTMKRDGIKMSLKIGWTSSTGNRLVGVRINDLNWSIRPIKSTLMCRINVYAHLFGTWE